MNYTEFAALIKTKYPAYKDIEDTLLVDKWIEKYPTYKDSLEMPDPTKLRVQPTLEELIPKREVTEPVSTQTAKFEFPKQYVHPTGLGQPVKEATKIKPEFFTAGAAAKGTASVILSKMIEQPAWNVTQLLAQGARGLSRFFLGKETPADNVLSTAVEFYSHPEKYGMVTPYATEWKSQQRLAAYSNGFVMGVASDIASMGEDLVSMYFRLGMYGKIAKTSQLMTANLNKQVFKQVRKVGVDGFLFSEGDIGNRIHSAIARIAYNITPYIANATGATGITASAVDTALNTFLTSPVYLRIYKEQGGITPEFLASAIPQFAMDIGMAISTRGLPANQRIKKIQNYVKRLNLQSNMSQKEKVQQVLNLIKIDYKSDVAKSGTEKEVPKEINEALKTGDGLKLVDKDWAENTVRDANEKIKYIKENTGENADKMIKAFDEWVETQTFKDLPIENQLEIKNDLKEATSAKEIIKVREEGKGAEPQVGEKGKPVGGVREEHRAEAAPKEEVTPKKKFDLDRFSKGVGLSFENAQLLKKYEEYYNYSIGKGKTKLSIIVNPNKNEFHFGTFSKDFDSGKPKTNEELILLMKIQKLEDEGGREKESYILEKQFGKLIAERRIKEINENRAIEPTKETPQEVKPKDVEIPFKDKKLIEISKKLLNNDELSQEELDYFKKNSDIEIGKMAESLIGKKWNLLQKAEKPAVAKPIEKQPYEMILSEYAKSELIKRGKTELAGRIKEGDFVDSYAPQHKKEIREALSRGDVVPKEVLKDYPELAKERITEPSKMIDYDTLSPTGKKVYAQAALSKSQGDFLGRLQNEGIGLKPAEDEVGKLGTFRTEVQKIELAEAHKKTGMVKKIADAKKKNTERVTFDEIRESHNGKKDAEEIIEVNAGLPVVKAIGNVVDFIKKKYHKKYDIDAEVASRGFRLIEKWAGEVDEGAVISQWAREDMYKLSRKKKDLKVVDDWLDNPEKYQADYDKLPQEAKDVGEILQTAYKDLLKVGEEQGILESTIEFYTPHVYQQSPARVKKIIESKLKTTFEFGKSRKYPTKDEAKEAGLKDIDNPIAKFEMYLSSLYKAMAGKKLVGLLNNMQTTTGYDVIMNRPKSKSKLAIWNKYVRVNIPQLDKWIYTGKDKFVRSGDTKVHPQVAKLLNATFSLNQNPIGFGHTMIRGYKWLRGKVKRVIMMNPLIHSWNIISDVLDEVNFNLYETGNVIKTGSDMWRRRDKDVLRAVKSSLNLNPRYGLFQAFRKEMGDLSSVRGIYGKTIGKVEEVSDKILFSGILRNSQLGLFKVLTKRVAKANPKMPMDEIDHVVSIHINNQVGTLPHYWFSKKAREIKSAALFAGNWTVSNVDLMVKGFTEGKVGLGIKSLNPKQKEVLGDMVGTHIAKGVFGLFASVNIGQALFMAVTNELKRKKLLDTKEYGDIVKIHSTFGNEGFRHFFDIKTGLKNKRGQNIYLVGHLFRWMKDIIGYADPTGTAYNKLEPLLRASLETFFNYSKWRNEKVVNPAANTMEKFKQLGTYWAKAMTPSQYFTDRPGYVKSTAEWMLPFTGTWLRRGTPKIMSEFWDWKAKEQFEKGKIDDIVRELFLKGKFAEGLNYAIKKGRYTSVAGLRDSFLKTFIPFQYRLKTAGPRNQLKFEQYLLDKGWTQEKITKEVNETANEETKFMINALNQVKDIDNEK